MDGYVEMLAPCPWRVAVRRAAELVAAAAPSNEVLRWPPEQASAVQVLSLLVYVVGREIGQPTTAALAAWVAPFVRPADEPTSVTGIAVDLSLLQAALGAALERAGHELPPAGDNSRVPVPRDPVTRVWRDLVVTVTLPDIDLYHALVPYGPAMNTGLHHAVNVIHSRRRPPRPRAGHQSTSVAVSSCGPWYSGRP